MIGPHYRLRAAITVGWASRVLGSWFLVILLMAASAKFLTRL